MSRKNRSTEEKVRRAKIRELLQMASIDRMASVELVDESICKKALSLRQSMDGYAEQVFKMYAGEPVDLTIRFSDKLIGVVYDKFGEGTKMQHVDENTCTATVRVQLSPTFWGWLFQFGGQMKITSSKKAVDEYKRQAAALG